MPPDAELVEVILGLGALELMERRLGLAAVVEQVGEIDPRLAVRRVELERSAEPVERPGVVPQPVRGVAETGGRVGRVGMGGGRQIEEPVGGRDVPLAEQRATDLQHELVIVLEAELQNPLERPHGPRAVAQLQQRLAQAGQAVLVVGVEREGVLEAPPRPGVLLPGQMGVGHPDVELDGMWVEGDAFLEDQQRFIVPAFVIELMGLFVEVVGAEKGVRHRRSSHR